MRRDSDELSQPNWGKIVKIGTGVVVGLMVLALVLHLGYITTVGADEVIVRFSAGRIIQVGGAGLYIDVGVFKSYVKYSRAGVPFMIFDPEVLTRASSEEVGRGFGQSIGLYVSGDVFRPGPEDVAFIMENWSKYRAHWTDTKVLVGDPKGQGTVAEGLLHRIGKQAMKVCVGERTFDSAVVGEARDELRACIEASIVGYADNYGLVVRNVVVPEVVLNEQQKKVLGEIGTARIETELARQKKEQAIVEGETAAALEQARIKVEQVKVQEKARQDAITAALNKAALDAQQQAIEAQKRNDLLSATKDLDIASMRKRVAEEDAKAGLAAELARAELFGKNPAYVQLLQVQALAAAYKVTDKIILPAGVSPLVILGQGVMPTIPITQAPQ